ncbi:unnamed protein product [Mytilus coruscus]|uniref:Uncharacterized protein n=1 Tax=Mytilus coruscus TaxID=42192 RepID=A0A6J8E8Z2_MYTCO|nr:unnamed protein product [Mytilus coruscus]
MKSFSEYHQETYATESTAHTFDPVFNRKLLAKENCPEYGSAELVGRSLRLLNNTDQEDEQVGIVDEEVLHTMNAEIGNLNNSIHEMLRQMGQFEQSLAWALHKINHVRLLILNSWKEQRRKYAGEGRGCTEALKGNLCHPVATYPPTSPCKEKDVQKHEQTTSPPTSPCKEEEDVQKHEQATFAFLWSVATSPPTSPCKEKEEDVQKHEQATFAFLWSVATSPPTCKEPSLPCSTKGNCFQTRNYQLDGRNKSTTKIGLADVTGAMLALCNDEGKVNMLREGNQIMMRNYIFRDTIFITSQT